MVDETRRVWLIKKRLKLRRLVERTQTARDNGGISYSAARLFSVTALCTVTVAFVSFAFSQNCD